MAGDATKLRIGDCDVYIDMQDGAGEQHLGFTKGGVEFTVDRTFEDLTADQHGLSPLDMALTGNDIRIKAYLAEPTNVNIARAIPEGLSASFASDSKAGIGRDSGYLLSQKAGILRLHPRKNTPSNRNEDVYIWKAVSVDNVELGYKTDEQRILAITYRGLVDTTQPDGQRLGRVGDADIS